MTQHSTILYDKVENILLFLRLLSYIGKHLLTISWKEVFLDANSYLKGMEQKNNQTQTTKTRTKAFLGILALFYEGYHLSQ